MKVSNIFCSQRISFGSIKNSQNLNHNITIQNKTEQSEINQAERYDLCIGRDLIIRETNDCLPKEILDKKPKGMTISQIVEQAQITGKILGQGANSVVYEIPALEDYVLKILNKDDPNKINMSEFPSSRNLGQPVWQNPKNPRMLILKKINGKEHSINNWSNTIWDNSIQSPRKVDYRQAETYFQKVVQIASFDQSAFDSIAADVKTLDDMGYKLDSINPNNLIVDADKKEVHVIDYFKVKPKEMDVYRNSAVDITSLILDFTLFPEYFDKLAPEKQAKLIECVEIINNKVNKGAENTGLYSKPDRYETYIRETSKWFPIQSVEKDDGNGEYVRAYDKRLDDFIEMLQEPHKWAQNR